MNNLDIVLAVLSGSILCLLLVAVYFLKSLLENKQDKTNNPDVDSLKDQLTGIKSSVDELKTKSTTQLDLMKKDIDYLTISHNKWERALNDTNYQGDLGEEALAEMLDTVGLQKDVDYFWEKEVAGFEKAKPDVYLKSSRGGNIVIDSKVSITSFVQAVNATDEKVKKRLMKQHADDIMNHAKALAKKRYHEYFKGAPEFTILFLHNIHLYLHALAQNPSIDIEARKMNIVIVTPPILYGFLKTVKLFNVQKDIEQSAQKISQIAQQVHTQLSKFIEHLNAVGRALTTAVKKYNTAQQRWHEKLLPKVSQLEELKGVEENKKLTDKLSRIEDSPIVIDEDKEITDNKLN